MEAGVELKGAGEQQGVRGVGCRQEGIDFSIYYRLSASSSAIPTGRFFHKRSSSAHRAGSQQPAVAPAHEPPQRAVPVSRHALSGSRLGPLLGGVGAGRLLPQNPGLGAGEGRPDPEPSGSRPAGGEDHDFPITPGLAVSRRFSGGERSFRFVP